MNAFRKNSFAGLIAVMIMVLAVAGMAMAEDSITGTITEKGEIIVLNAADGSYVLEGSDMTPDMIGKKVTVTGTVAEKDNVKVINVLSMEEVKE
jgi:hypothetical protein